MLNYELILDDISARLQSVRWALRQTCEHLLEDLSLPDDEIAELLNKQKGWESKELNEVLLSRMGTGDYVAFVNAATSINRQLRLLGDDLGLDSTWTVSQHSIPPSCRGSDTTGYSLPTAIIYSGWTGRYASPK